MEESSTTHFHEAAYRPEDECPLDGVRVLDLSRLVSGNMVTHLLADFGAEVIKIEHPKRGDDLRNWRVEGVQTYWKVYGRNKKSLALDITCEAGRSLLLNLAGTADVLVENFVPGKMERLGLGPKVLQEANPKLVMVRISGWGQTGPYRSKPGFGTLVEAMSGFAAMNGFGDRHPVLPPLAMADMVAGLSGAMATMIALRTVEVSGGKGQIIDLSLFEPIFSILGPLAANYRLTRRVPRRLGSLSEISAPRNTYECSDGKFVALSAAMQGMAERLFRLMGREDLINDPRFRTNSDRLCNNDELDAIVAEFIARRTQQENLELFEGAAITVSAVTDIADLSAHPYISEREIVMDFPDEEVGMLPMHNITPRLSQTPGVVRSPAPRLGQDSESILSGLGLTAEEIKRLREEEVI